LLINIYITSNVRSTPIILQISNSKGMKSFIYALIAVALIATGCKKGPSPVKPDDNKPPVDKIAELNKKITGKWLYPTFRSKVVDNTGTVLIPDFYIGHASAFEFDGNNTFTEYASVQITNTSTYLIHKKNGLNYLDFGPGNSFRIQTLNDTTLELTDTIPANGIPNAKQIYYYKHIKMKAADTAAKFRVWVTSDSINTLFTYITNAIRPGAPLSIHKIVDYKLGLAGQSPFYYVYDHAILPGDLVTLSMDCLQPRTFCYIYYKGVIIYDYRFTQNGLWKIVSNPIPPN
jgi:hypothetical protein